MQDNKKKNYRKPRTGKIRDGWIYCPRCGRPVARAYYGGCAVGIEVKCSKCGVHVLIELSKVDA